MIALQVFQPAVRDIRLWQDPSQPGPAGKGEDYYHPVNGVPEDLPYAVAALPRLFDHGARVLFIGCGRFSIGINRLRFRFGCCLRRSSVSLDAAVHVLLDLFRCNAIVLRFAPALGLNIGVLLRFKRRRDRRDC